MKKLFCIFAALFLIPFASCARESGADTLTLDILAGSGAEKTEIDVCRTDVVVISENGAGDAVSLKIRTGEAETAYSFHEGDLICVFEPLAETGYSFGYWRLNGGDIAASADGSLTFEVGKSDFLEGFFVKNSYRISVSSNKKGLSFSSETYCAGDRVTLRPEIPEGYKLLGYRITGAEAELSADGTVTLVMPANNVNVEVQLFEYERVSVREETIGLIFWVLAAFAFAGVTIFKRKDKGEND